MSIIIIYLYIYIWVMSELMDNFYRLYNNMIWKILFMSIHDTIMSHLWIIHCCKYLSNWTYSVISHNSFPILVLYLYFLIVNSPIR